MRDTLIRELPVAKYVPPSFPMWTPEAKQLYIEKGVVPIGGSALDHDTIIYDVHDVKLFKMLTDTGASPTYATGVDLPGIQQVAINPEITANQLKGDAKIIDRRARVDGVTLSMTGAKFSLNVLDAVLTGTLADSGTTPNQTSSFLLAGGSVPPYFGVIVQFEDVDIDIGMVRAVLWKAKISGGTWLASQTDQYGSPTVEAGAIATDSHNRMVAFQEHETRSNVPTAAFPA